MLIAFEVSNFRSIKEPVVLNLTKTEIPAGNREEPALDAKTCGCVDRIAEVMFVGSAGAGKSNVLKAIETAVSVIEQSLTVQPGQELKGIEPFRFDPQTSEQPSVFAFTFLLDEKLYRYGFSASRKRIAEEFLLVQEKGKWKSVFRRNGQDFQLPKKEKHLALLVKMTGENQLLLSRGAQFNSRICSDIFSELTNAFVRAKPEEVSARRVWKQMAETEQAADCKAWLLKTMQELDLELADFELESDDGFSFLPGNRSFRIFHVFNQRVFSQPLQEESSGFQKVFSLLMQIYDVLQNGKILLADHLGRGLHLLVVQKILKLFTSSVTNPNQAQLLFTSSDPCLTVFSSSKKCRIYLVEKDQKNQSTLMKELDDSWKFGQPVFGFEQHLQQLKTLL